MVWTNKRETNCKGHYTRDYGLRYVRMASDRAHANDGVMSGMGISKVKSQGLLNKQDSFGICNREGVVQSRDERARGKKEKTES